jgi:peptide/nickel transport system substrate-binding protein
MGRDREASRGRSDRDVISRRELMRRAALLGVSAGALTGPMTGGRAAAQTGPGPIKRGGTLVHSVNWTVPTMDPHLASQPEHIIYEQLYDGLLRLDRVDASSWEHKVVGVLAESWEQKDARTLVFKLRQGVRFHDGSVFDAELARWNILRARDHPKSEVKASLRAIDSVTALDKSTLEVKAKTDNAALLRILAFTGGGSVRMVSRAALEKNGEPWLQRNPAGTGPFRFKQWISDDRVIMERNPDYFAAGADGKPLPYLDGLVIRFIPDPTVALVDMRAGTVHFVERLALKDADTVKGDSRLALVELPWAGQIYFEVGFNTEAPPFNDVRVRQAALYGIDRAGMHQALGFGLGRPVNYPYAIPGTVGYDESVVKYDYNPEKVKALLKEAGHPNGVSIELKVIAREPENTIGEFAQQMWSAVGIKTRLVTLERLAWIDQVRAKNFQANFWRGALWALVDPELARHLVASGAPGNWSQFKDADVDRLLDEGLASLDPRKRAGTYRQVWQTLQERAYVGSGFLAPIVSGYRREMRGLTFNFLTPTLRGAWLA